MASRPQAGWPGPRERHARSPGRSIPVDGYRPAVASSTEHRDGVRLGDAARRASEPMASTLTTPRDSKSAALDQPYLRRSDSYPWHNRASPPLTQSPGPDGALGKSDLSPTMPANRHRYPAHPQNSQHSPPQSQAASSAGYSPFSSPTQSLLSPERATYSWQQATIQHSYQPAQSAPPTAHQHDCTIAQKFPAHRFHSEPAPYPREHVSGHVSKLKDLPLDLSFSDMNCIPDQSPSRPLNSPYSSPISTPAWPCTQPTQSSSGSQRYSGPSFRSEEELLSPMAAMNATNNEKNPQRSSSWGSPALRRRVKRRAMIIGIQYKSTEKELRGVRVDILALRTLLLSQAYEEDSILVYSDADNLNIPNVFEPTTESLIYGFHCVTYKLKRFDSVVVFFAGHGGVSSNESAPNQSDENTAFLLPVDHSTTGPMTSSTLSKHLVSRIPDECQLLFLADSCFSGAMFDLPFVYDKDQQTWHTDLPPSKRRDHQPGLSESILKALNPMTVHPIRDGKFQANPVKEKPPENTILVIAACAADELSFEVGGGQESAAAEFGGNMTAAFIGAVNSVKPDGGTWRDLVSYLQYKIERLSRIGVLQYGQNSRISCNHMYDMNKPFAL